MISVALKRRERIASISLQVFANQTHSSRSEHGSPRGSWVYMAEGIKKAVNIPVMVAKRIPKIW